MSAWRCAWSGVGAVSLLGRLVVLALGLGSTACGLLGEASPADQGSAADLGGAPDQVIWRNGRTGTWVFTNGNSVGIETGMYNGTKLTPVAAADTVTGGVPSLQMTCSNMLTCHAQMTLAAGGQGSLELARYHDGHLCFDIQLMTADAADVEVKLFPPLSVRVPVDPNDLTHFVPVALALTPDLYGSDGPMGSMPPGPVFDIEVKLAILPTPNQPMIQLNNVRWTAN